MLSEEQKLQDNLYKVPPGGGHLRNLLKVGSWQFYPMKGKSGNIELSDIDSMDKSDNNIKDWNENSRLLIDLLRLIPNYSDRNSFRKKKQLIDKGDVGKKMNANGEMLKIY